MGFELNRIMKQYGVSTPGVINYSGAAAPSVPTAPTGERPEGDDSAAKARQSAYDKQLADFNTYKTDPSAFNEMARKYLLDQKSYDTYKADYQNRLSNTPMYLQSQFDTGYGTMASTTPTGSVMRDYADKPDGIGVDRANINIQNWFAQNPSASAADIAAAKAEWSVTDADIKNAMGSGFKYGDGKPAGYGSDMARYALGPGGIGMDAANNNIKKYLADNPYATTAQIKAEADRWGVENKDMYNATGSYHGNQLKGPTYGAVPLSLGNQTEQNKIDYYRSQRELGYNDADLRTAAENSFGKIPDTDWNYLRDKAIPPMPVLGGTGGGTDDSVYGPDGQKYSSPTEAIAAGVDNYTLTPPNINPLTGNDVTQKARGGSIRKLAAKYAGGGTVKTHYQTAGAVTLPSGYGSEDEEAAFRAMRERDSVPVEIQPVDMSSPPAPMITEAQEVVAPLTQVALKEAKAAPEPAAPAVSAAPTPVAPKPPAALPFGGERLAGIQALLASYGPKDSAYGAELRTARAAAKAESDAFAKLLSGAMKSPDDEKSSKAEMYFRLAAAFGAPTKTGSFSENLGMVGRELGEYSKDKRASAQQKLALAIKAQEMKMTGAKEDLRSLQALTGEEMKDKRAIATELIKDYIKSGEPQSAAGKQALDEGLKAGTPEYQKRVQEIGNMNIEGKMAQITASLANVNMAAANLALSQNKFENQKQQQAKLSPAEVKLKTETEETVAQTDQALVNLKKAYALNPNTFDTSLVDTAQRKLLEAGGSKDPKVIATRELENLLEKAALSQLKSTFPGAISNDERKALQDVQGLGAKSKEERAVIMKNAYTALKSVSERHRKRLADINQGVYRDATSTIDGGNE
jgi:hypothetical protein